MGQMNILCLGFSLLLLSLSGCVVPGLGGEDAGANNGMPSPTLTILSTNTESGTCNAPFDNAYHCLTLQLRITNPADQRLGNDDYRLEAISATGRTVPPFDYGTEPHVEPGGSQSFQLRYTVHNNDHGKVARLIMEPTSWGSNPFPEITKPVSY